jgi:ADP-ribosyl-[dinitrogen reductase] hydrolase
MMIKGSCACGGVKYQAEGFSGPFIFCHCDDCKKTHSTAFSANITVKSEDFTVTQGKDKLTEYKPFPNKTRYFCSVCGSHIMHEIAEDTEHIRIKAGTVIDGDDFNPGEYEKIHIFCDYDTPWTEYEGGTKYSQAKND